MNFHWQRDFALILLLRDFLSVTARPYAISAVMARPISMLAVKTRPFGLPEALLIFLPIFSFGRIFVLEALVKFRIFVDVPPEALPILATAIALLERRTPKDITVPRATEDTRAIAGGEIVPCATEDTRAIAGGDIVPTHNNVGMTTGPETLGDRRAAMHPSHSFRRVVRLLPDDDKIDVGEKTIHTQDKEVEEG